jgi:hypothetical protein
LWDSQRHGLTADCRLRIRIKRLLVFVC